MTTNENRTNTRPCIPSTYRQWVVSRSHSDDLTPSSFEQRLIETPALSDEEALVRVKLLNVHSATRLRIARGIVAHGETDPNSCACAEVVRSRDPAFVACDLIACQAGWQEYAVICSSARQWGLLTLLSSWRPRTVRIRRGTFVICPALARQWSVSVLMEVFGTSGMTAWFGLRENGLIMPRDTVAVAATTGSFGSIVAQMARAAGARVVGFAGGPDRCRRVRENLDIDACIDYRSPRLDVELSNAFPEGIDVFSDGVGGELTERVVARMNRHGRLVSYGSAATSYAPDNVRAPSVRPAMRQTFGVSDKVEQLLHEHHVKSGLWTVGAFYHERITAENDLSRLLSMSRIKPHAHVFSGFENLPWAISDKYRLPRAGKLQISFD